MSRKANSFFEHPTVMLKIPPRTAAAASQQNPEQTSAINSKLVSLKQSQISEKREILQSLRMQNQQLQLLTTNYESSSQPQQVSLQQQLQELSLSLQQIQSEIASTQQLENIDIEEYIEWRHAEAKKRHFERIEDLRRKYSEMNGHKIEEIGEVSREVEEMRADLRDREGELQRERAVVVEERREEDWVMPNVRALGAELGYLREKVRNLRDSKKLAMAEVKQQLNSNTWSVKKNFEDSKDRIAKQMKKLMQYIDKPEKQVIPSSPQGKIPNPLSLIEAYQTRLSQLQQILPQQLKSQQILKCLRPLPWRSIKGTGIDPSTSQASQIHEKFNRLQQEFVDSEARHNQLKTVIRQKDAEIDKLLQLLTEMEEKTKQYKSK